MSKIQHLLDRYKRLILPFLLSCVLSLSVYDIYRSDIPTFVWLIPIAALNIGLFAFCGFVKKHNFIGGALMGVVILAAMKIFFDLISGGDYGLTFQRWLLTGSEKVSTRAEYLVALMISFVPFFSVVVYYFTDVLYRMMFLTLLSIVPCALYVKVLSEIDTIYLSLIALLNVAIFLAYSRGRREEKTINSGRQASILSAAMFIFVLLVVSSAIPKEEEARYYDRFEALFMDNAVDEQLNGEYSNFTEMSGNADRYRDFKERRLYTVEIPYAPYFKRQCFDFYDFSIDRWNNQGSDYSDITYTTEEWSDLYSDLSLTELRRALIRTNELSEGFAEKYNQRRFMEFTGLTDDTINCVVSSESFPAMYFLSPARIIDVRPYGNRQIDEYGVTKNGVFRFRTTTHPYNFTYAVQCRDEVFPRSYWFSLRAGDIDLDTSLTMLREMDEILTDAGEDALAERVESHIAVTEDALEYKAMTEANTALISDDIRELAEQITQGYTYDWEKANALATYFLTNGYTYDLQYISADTTPEHFLFTSKRGSCSDYASAYVLMARAVGIPARYCEGYMADPSSTDNIWLVKDSGSHAYPEVFLYGLGWTVFEPTVPGDYNDMQRPTGGLLSNLTFDTDLMMTMFIISGIILAIVIIGVALIPVIAESRFLSRLERCTPDESAIVAYDRIRSKSGRLVKNAPSLTAYELSSKIDKKAGTSFTPAAFILERVLYGGGHADASDKKSVIDMYISTRDGIKKYLRDLRRNERRKYR